LTISELTDESTAAKIFVIKTAIIATALYFSFSPCCGRILLLGQQNVIMIYIRIKRRATANNKPPNTIEVGFLNANIRIEMIKKTQVIRLE
jgi:hypothetical protein